MLGILGAGLFGLHKFLLNFLLTDALCAFSVDRLTFTSIQPAWACSGNEDALSGNRFLIKLCLGKLLLTSSHLLRAPVCLTRASLHTLGLLVSTLRRFCWHLPPHEEGGGWGGGGLLAWLPTVLTHQTCLLWLMSRRRGLARFDAVAITTGEASWAARVQANMRTKLHIAERQKAF